jgi:hypothetical protein
MRKVIRPLVRHILSAPFSTVPAVILWAIFNPMIEWLLTGSSYGVQFDVTDSSCGVCFLGIAWIVVLIPLSIGLEYFLARKMNLDFKGQVQAGIPLICLLSVVFVGGLWLLVRILSPDAYAAGDFLPEFEGMALLAADLAVWEILYYCMYLFTKRFIIKQ